MKRARPVTPATRAAASLLGAQITQARKERGWTAKQLAERVGVEAHTISRIERGEPTVAIGLFFETAVITGVPLFGVDDRELAPLESTARRQLALLPTRVTKARVVIDDDF